MSSYKATTVPTQFVEANGIRFAYRRWGKPSGLPLVFNQHFTGNLDNWDPAVLDGLAHLAMPIHCMPLTYDTNQWDSRLASGYVLS